MAFWKQKNNTPKQNKNVQEIKVFITTLPDILKEKTLEEIILFYCKITDQRPKNFKKSFHKNELSNKYQNIM